MVAKLSTIRRKIRNGEKLGFSERARAVNKGLLPSKVKKRKIKNGDKLGFSERARAVNKGLLPSKAKKRKNVKK